MLDELNRSLPGVQQSFFQLVLDRALGNDKNGEMALNLYKSLGMDIASILETKR